MANTNATYATSIAVDLPDYPAATVTFTSAAFFVSGNSEVLPSKQYSLTLDSSGQGTQTLPCPDNTGDSAINWRINLPSKESGTYAIAYSAIVQNLSDILAAQSTTADPDNITAAIAAKANKLPGGTEDNLFSIDANGDLQDSGFAAADFDAAGAAAAVASDLSDHESALVAHGFVGVQSAPFTTTELDASGKWGLCSSGNQLHANIGGTVRAFPAVSPYPSKVLQYSPAAYYRLNELAGLVGNDLSGNGHNGTYSSTVVLSKSPAPFDGVAPLFASAGTDSEMQLPLSLDAAFDGAEGAIVVFAKVLSSTIWTDGLNHYIFRIGVDGNNDIFVNKSSTNNRVILRRTAGAVNRIVNLDAISNTDWIMLGLEWSQAGDFVKAYYNGVQTGSTLTSIGTWAGGALANRRVGTSSASANGWDGYIAEVAIFSAPIGAVAMAALATDALG